MFGAVYVEAKPESYLKLANDLDVLRKLPGYLAHSEIQQSPTAFRSCEIHSRGGGPERPEELQAGRLRRSVAIGSDGAISKIRELEGGGCREPGESDWRNKWRSEALLAYQKGGNAALGVYRDKGHPTRVAETFQALLSRLTSLPVYLPDVNRILLEYPGVEPSELALRVLLGKG